MRLEFNPLWVVSWDEAMSITKKQWRQQANDYLQRILRLLKIYEGVDSIGQGPYKGDFFKIFADAFRSGYCTPGHRADKEKGTVVRCKAQRPLICGDEIWAYAKSQGWVHGEVTREEKRYCDIETVKTWWDEWTYAWIHHVPRRKYVRRSNPV